jgi:hypothetical protein
MIFYRFSLLMKQYLVSRRDSYEFREFREKYRNNQHLLTSPVFLIKTGMNVKETLQFLCR